MSQQYGPFDPRNSWSPTSPEQLGAKGDNWGALGAAASAAALRDQEQREARCRAERLAVHVDLSSGASSGHGSSADDHPVAHFTGVVLGILFLVALFAWPVALGLGLAYFAFLIVFCILRKIGLFRLIGAILRNIFSLRGLAVAAVLVACLYFFGDLRPEALQALVGRQSVAPPPQPKTEFERPAPHKSENLFTEEGKAFFRATEARRAAESASPALAKKDAAPASQDTAPEAPTQAPDAGALEHASVSGTHTILARLQTRHMHGFFGSCEGQLISTDKGLHFEPSQEGGHVLDIPSSAHISFLYRRGIIRAEQPEQPRRDFRIIAEQLSSEETSKFLSSIGIDWHGEPDHSNAGPQVR